MIQIQANLSQKRAIEQDPFDLIITISGKNLFNYRLEYPRHLDLYGFQETGADFSSREKTFDDTIEQEYQITYHLKAREYFRGEMTLNPILIKLEPGTMEDPITLSTPRLSITITEMEWYKQPEVWGLSLAAAILLVIGVSTALIIKFINKRKLIKETTDETRHGEIIFAKYIETRERLGKKGNKPVLKLFSNLLLEYIELKYGITTWEDFYRKEGYEDSIKKEVKSFLDRIQTLRYAPDDPGDQTVEELENDFKTLLFVV